MNADRRKDWIELRHHGPQILPSLLRCDFGDLRGEVARLAAAGTRGLHLDVMDGHFVPNLTYGMPIVEGLANHTDMPLDVHLMITDPVTFAEPMVRAGASMLTFHVEAAENADAVRRTVEHYRSLGVGVGIAVNPDTSLDGVRSVIDDVDMVLIMSVQAGFGGQSFRDNAVQRIAQIRRWRSDVLIEVDGGIDPQTIGRCRDAGCDWFVVGSAIFGQTDYAAAIAELETKITDGAGS